METKDEKYNEKEDTRSQQGMHPGVAAAIGAVVGAAGGVAVAMASQNPEIRKKAKEQFDILSKKATDAWNDMNTSGKTGLKHKAHDDADTKNTAEITKESEAGIKAKNSIK